MYKSDPLCMKGVCLLFMRCLYGYTVCMYVCMYVHLSVCVFVVFVCVVNLYGVVCMRVHMQQQNPFVFDIIYSFHY